MNYIELINRFWQCEIERVSTPSDAKLYFYLLHTCNALRWKQPFGHSDRHLSSVLNMAVNTVRDSKNRLKQCGLIDFRAPEKKSKGMEGQCKFWFPTVSPIDTDTDTVPNTVGGAYMGSRASTVSATDTVSNTVADTVQRPPTRTALSSVSMINTDADTVPDTDVDTVPDTVSDTNNKLNKTKLNQNSLKGGETILRRDPVTAASETVVVGTQKKEKPPQLRPAPPSPPEFPLTWTPGMVDLYQNTWLPFYRRKTGKTMQPDSIKLQIQKLSVLDEAELKACIESSISNNYQGLFPDKFKRRHVPQHSPQTQSRTESTAAAGGRYEFDLDRELARRASWDAGGQSVDETDFQVVE